MAPHTSLRITSKSARSVRHARTSCGCRLASNIVADTVDRAVSVCPLRRSAVASVRHFLIPLRTHASHRAGCTWSHEERQ